MNIIHLTDEELVMARHALQAYFQAFGHDEPDTLVAIRRVLAKFRAAEPEGELDLTCGSGWQTCRCPTRRRPKQSLERGLDPASWSGLRTV